MRAQKEGKHVSGAERIVNKEEIEKVIKEFVKRPSDFDFMNIKIEEIKKFKKISFNLEINSFIFSDVKSAREFAVKKLSEQGISEEIAGKAIDILSKGANPKGGNMRGAVLIDIETGERLEPDKERGIRTVHFDWENREAVTELLLTKGYTLRTVDALALTTKNLYCGVVAELCWSDDPDYVTGYVSGKEIGYVRITPLKEMGNPFGGRVYFIKRKNLKKVLNCLEKEVVLINYPIGLIKRSIQMKSSG